MLDNLPDETTDLLIDICTSLTPLSIGADEEEAAPAKQSGGGTSYLFYLTLNRASVAEPNTQTNGTKAPEPIVRQDSVHEASQASTPPPATPTTATAVKQLESGVRPSPRLYFAHFVDHPEHFVRFLETVSRKRWGQTVENTSEPLAVEADPDADMQAEARDQATVWNTLFELYLAQPGGGEAKALAVLQNARLPYDPTHAYATFPPCLGPSSHASPPLTNKKNTKSLWRKKEHRKLLYYVSIRPRCARLRWTR